MKQAYEAPEVQVLEMEVQASVMQMSGKKGYDPTDTNPFGGNN